MVRGAGGFVLGAGLLTADGSILRSVRTVFDAVNPDLLLEAPDVEMVSGPTPPSSSALFVDSRSQFQEILGFGGAFTEASATNWRSMTEDEQAEIIRLYFASPADGGHGYTLGRVPMGSCDFSAASYSFDDVANDSSLLHFDSGVTHDEAVGMLPMIRAAQEATRAWGQNLTMYASPWSPPAWMKLPVDADGNYSMLGSAIPNGLDPQFQGAWAKYFSKFIDAYRARGVDLWGVTVQNEPENRAAWEGCVYTPQFQAGFVRNHLGPTLRSEQPGVKIIGFDHNKDHVNLWAEVLYGDEVTASFFDGLGVHWYGGLNTQHLQETHEIAPEKFILGTEACNCGGVVFRDDPALWWSRAEALALDISADLNFWAVGWTDWNLVLNPQGGPNHLNNLCDANIIFDHKESKGFGRLVMQASYYYMGHYSRFVPPGSRRIGLVNRADVRTPTVTRADVVGKRLMFNPCSGNAAQAWDYDQNTRELSIFGMCVEPADDGVGLLMADCSGNANQQFALQASADASNSSQRLVNSVSHKCLTSLQLNGDAVGMDAGVDVVAAQAFDCRLDADPDFKTWNQDWLLAGSASFPGMFQVKYGALDICLEPVGIEKVLFDAVAFQTPSGDISLIAINVGDLPISFDIVDVAAGLSARSVEVPPHGIISYSWGPSPSSFDEEGPEVIALTTYEGATEPLLARVAAAAAVMTAVGGFLISRSRRTEPLPEGESADYVRIG